MHHPRIVIITAIKSEFEAVGAALPQSARDEGVLVRGGVGPEVAARALRIVLESSNPPRLICTTGFCGGLKDGLEVGDVVLADALLDGRSAPEQAIKIETTLVEKLAATLNVRQIRHSIGSMISTPSIVTRCENKRALAATSGAIAVDMESFALAANLNSRITRLCALRVVSDSVTDELPPEVISFLNSNGDVNTANVARFGLRSLRNMKILWDLKGRSDKAATALTAAWRNVWPTFEKEEF
ncbi:MAG: hypothetical protein V1899_00445 [Planctomycetota bacterium]